MRGGRLGRALGGAAALLAALLTAFGAAGCRVAYQSAVDLVADAAVEAPAFMDGVYCPVTVYPDVTDIETADCRRLAWDPARARHYASPVDVAWDPEGDRPRARPFLDGFGARSTWIDVAALPRGLLLAQATSMDGGAEAAPGLEGSGFRAVVARASEGGFAILPVPEEAMLAGLAAERGLGVELSEDQAEPRVRIAGGESAETRGFLADAAVAWLEARRAQSGDFRQPRADREQDGPVYYVRLEALRAELPLEAAIQTALFDVETAVAASARGEE